MAYSGWRNGRAELPALAPPVTDPVVERLQAELDASGELALQQARVALLALDTRIVELRAEVARLVRSHRAGEPQYGAPVVSEAGDLRHRAATAARRRAEARALDEVQVRLAAAEGERWATADAFRREALTLVGVCRALASIYWGANLRSRREALPAALQLPAPEAGPALLELIEILEGPNLAGVLDGALAAAGGPALEDIRAVGHTATAPGIG